MSKNANNEVEGKVDDDVENDDLEFDTESEDSIPSEDGDLKEDSPSKDDEYQKELEELEGTKKRSKKDVKKQRREHYKKRQAYKRQEEEYDDEDDSNDEDLREFVLEQNERLREEITRSRISELVSRYTRNENEAKLAKYHLENSLKPSGDLDADVKNAVALANRSRIQNELEEVKRSYASKDSTSNYSGGGQRPKVKQKIKLSEKDKRIIEDFKITPEQVKESLSKN